MKSGTEELREEDESEAALTKRAGRGDHAAFAELVDRTKGKVFSIIMRQVRDQSLAEELSQEVFIRAYRGLPNFQQKSSFSTWVIRIALNHSHSYFKSKTFKKSLLKQPLDELELPSSEGETEALREKMHRAELLRRALGKLGRKYRDVIVLHSLEGKSYAEVAEILEIKTGTVGSRMNQGIKLLQDEIRRLNR